MPEVEARTVLWYLTFFGFAVNYMIRINLNITIVEMVKSTSLHKTELFSNQMQNGSVYDIKNHTNFDEIIDEDLHEKHLYKIESSNISLRDKIKLGEFSKDNKHRATIESMILDKMGISYDRDGMHINEYQQGLILGSFFWLHWVTQIPGGILAKKYGTKLVFGLSNAVGTWICFVLPLLAYIDYRLLIFARIIQGLICGLAWPAMHHLTAQWIPPNERSKFVTAYLGSSVGIAVFYPLFGFVMSWTTWELVFHLCGITGTIWYLAWRHFIYDTPSCHPRISENEKNFIEKSLGSTVVLSTNHGPTPWKDILISKSVWMNVIAQWGGIWGLFTLMTQAPTYFKIIHHWNIRMTGLLSGLPHLLRMIFAYFFSIFGDYLLKTEKMTRTNVRKLATTVCCIIKGLFVLALAYSGNSSTASVIFLSLATMAHGAVSTGPLASIVDIAPNYAGIVLGISGMITVLPGFISPIVVGMLTLGNQTVTSWKYVFLITSGMLIGSGILYDLFCDSTLQSWNNPSSNVILSNKELQILNSNKNLNIINGFKVNNDDNNIENDKSKENQKSCVNKCNETP
ncbi:sialin [Condylostylus longicornis]|uniref:sialin n=1 Tax=Condylostylus longicornis TaxID=2530218 RepID=UPI00244E0328|nr:sialin [Condylostylus longicornis]